MNKNRKKEKIIPFFFRTLAFLVCAIFLINDLPEGCSVQQLREKMLKHTAVIIVRIQTNPRHPEP
jgi:hypothetical protein